MHRYPIWKIKHPGAYESIRDVYLSNRNLTSNQIDNSTDHLHDPYLMHDMERGVSRIETAIRSGEQITVFGDYDADGVTSTALLLDFLDTVSATAKPLLPDRYRDGYGMKASTVEKALADADSKNRVLTTEAKTLRDSRDDALETARVQAGTEARILRDELEAVSADLEGSRRDLSAARAREQALAARLTAYEIKLAEKWQTAAASNDDVDKERIVRANARIAELTDALGEVEDERFELRRALEAHVTALVEAKVDSAELAGTVAELRKELARVNVRYQRAAARCAKMEAREVRGDAVARVGHRGLGRVGDDAANSPA